MYSHVGPWFQLRTSLSAGLRVLFVGLFDPFGDASTDRIVGEVVDRDAVRDGNA